jgi:hypothetical protein
MKTLRKYLGRVLEAWWIKLILSLESVLSLVAFVLFFLVPDFSFPWWVFWLFGFAIILTFGTANLMLFGEQESEIQELQDYINELEDTRADILTKKTQDFCYAASLHSRYFSHEGKTFHQTSDHLHKNGLPIGLVIGAELKVTKRSNEPGDLDWKITEVDLPRSFDLLEDNKGSFQWGPRGGAPLDRIERFLYEQGARYELPIKVTEQDPRRFAHSLRSLGSYHIVVKYRTKRFDSESKPHHLILEGDFQEFRDEICRNWKNCRLDELAQLAKCQ